GAAGAAGTGGGAVGGGRGAGLASGLRREGIALARHGGIPATVEGAEYLGADSIHTCRVGSESLAVRLAGAPDVPLGGAVALGWSSDAVHVFDRASGRRPDDLAARPLALAAA